MRILYGVTGEGLGHAMRARALVEHLLSRGHEVLAAASGRAFDVLRAHHEDTVPIEGLRLRYGHGALLRTSTLSANLRAAPRAIVRNAQTARAAVAGFAPEIVISDFDSFSSAVGRLLDLPVISFDHQHVVDRFVHPPEVTQRLSSDFHATRAVIASKVRRASHFVVTSFFFPEPRCRHAERTTLVGPVVRAAVRRARPTSGEHVVVYQTAKDAPFVLDVLRAHARVPFVVYGLGAQPSRGNVIARAFDEGRFIEDLASARAVIANGGFTTLSEAIVLGKPVLSVPLLHQGEQELNAAWLEHLGLGICARRLDAPAIARLLARDASTTPSPASDPRIASGTDDAFRAIDEALVRAFQRAA